MIKTENIKKSFGSLEVLKGINLEIPNGKIYSIVGASGAGKTTLLQILGTLSKPDSGNLYINDKEISSFSEKQLSAFRNKQLGFVFQFHHLLPEFTALENVCMPAFVANAPRKATEKKAMQLLDFLNLGHRIQHKPGQLSGGEQQRVAAARALINDPKIILADEPSGNLDTKSKKELHDLFFKLNKEFNQTILIVTHDMDLAGMAQRKIQMNDGEIISDHY